MAEQAPPAPTSGSVDPAADPDSLTKGIEELRGGLRKAGTVLGSAATALIGGLGYATLHNLFPAPVGDEWLYAVAAAGALLAALGAASLAGRFFAGQRRVLLSTSVPTTWKQRRRRGLRKRDVEVIRRVFADHAYEEGARDLYTLELRALRLERVARDGDPAERTELAAEAARLQDLVRIAFKRAAASVVERRSQDAVAGWPSRIALVAALVGVIALWGAADYSKGQRDLIDLRQKCAKAVKEGATTACEPVVPAPAVQPVDAAAAKQAKQKQRQQAKVRRQRLRTLQRTLGAGGRAVARRRRCAELAADRLKDRPEAVVVAAVEACATARQRRQ